MAEDLLGGNRIEDVQWLCSLSESELDMLISLKTLVLQRAKVVGHDALAEKFDLKMLRVLSFILMQHLKGQLTDLSAVPGLAESSAILDGCNLLKCNINDSLGTMGIEELKAFIGRDRRKRVAEMFSEDLTPNHKKKN